MNCYLHPSVGATTTCWLCKRDICPQCIDRVAGRLLCKPCSRREQQRALGGGGPLAPGHDPDFASQQPQPTVQVAPQPQTAASMATGYRPQPMVVDSVVPDAGHYLVAFLNGVAALLIGAFLWGHIVRQTQLQIGYFVIGIALLVGFAVRLGCGGRCSIGTSMMGALLAGGGVFFGNMMAVYQELSASPRSAASLAKMGGADRIQVLFEATLKAMGPLDWLVVVVGAYLGWRISSKNGG